MTHDERCQERACRREGRGDREDGADLAGGHPRPVTGLGRVRSEVEHGRGHRAEQRHRDEHAAQHQVSRTRVIVSPIRALYPRQRCGASCVRGHALQYPNFHSVCAQLSRWAREGLRHKPDHGTYMLTASWIHQDQHQPPAPLTHPTEAQLRGIGPQRGYLTGPNPVDRSEQGSKIHLIMERTVLPISIGISGANLHDSQALEPLVRGIPPIRSRRGPRRRRSGKLHADKGYDYDHLRRWLRQRGIRHRIARKGIESEKRLGVLATEVGDRARAVRPLLLRRHTAGTWHIVRYSRPADRFTCCAGRGRARPVLCR